MGKRKSTAWAILSSSKADSAGRAAEKELAQAVRTGGGLLTSPQIATHFISLDSDASALSPEGYQIVSRVDNEKLYISCAARDRTGLLYAAYDLADRIRYQEPLHPLNMTESPYCHHRQITTHICHHDFLKHLIKTMPRWRMNTLLLDTAYHVPVERPFIQFYGTLPIAYRNNARVKAMIQTSRDFQHVQSSFTRLLRFAHDYGVSIYLRFLCLGYTRVDASGGHYAEGYRGQHLREDFPHLFREGNQQPDWNLQAVWDFIREQLEELFEMYPEVAGITVQTDEMACFGTGHVDSPGTPEERGARTRRMVETVEEVCARYGKRGYWDMHGSWNTYLNALLEFARERPDGLRLRAESVPIQQIFSDGFPSYPFARIAEAGDGMFDHDIQMEGLGDFPWLPTILDRYIIRHTLKAIQAGLRSGSGMWYIHAGPFYTPLNNLSQINMELLSRLLWNPAEPVDRIWKRWLRRRFGKRAAKSAGHVLRSTHEVLNGILYFNNLNASFAWFQFCFPKNLDYFMDAKGWKQAIECFQPAGTPLYSDPWSAVCKERTISVTQMREEKRTAIRQAEALLEYLIAHKNDFHEGDYRVLLPRYVSLLYYARAAADLVEALYNFTNLHIRAYDPECIRPREGMERALQSLEEINTEAHDDDRLLLLEPDVYYRGLKGNFLDNILTMIADIRFYDRVLSNPEDSINGLADEDKERARQILTNVERIREKFEYNTHLDIAAEELWARALGESVVDDQARGLFVA